MSSDDAFKIVRLAPDREMVPRIARAMIEQYARDLPDLSGVVLVVPSLAMGPEVRAALGQAAGRALILPRIVTLREWAESRLSGVVCRSDNRRQVDLFHALKARRWLDGADLWAVAAELVALFDELTELGLGLPPSEAELSDRLEAAYALRSCGPLRFEASLIHALWRADAQEGLSRSAARALALARLAAEADKPLHMIWEGELAPRELAFVKAYADRQAVTLYLPDRRLAEHAAVRLANLAWPAEGGAGHLLARAAASVPLNLTEVGGRVQLMPCENLERQAWAVSLVIRNWLAAGRRNIALVAADRLAARRARALLERSDVLLQDETGWKLSTTRAAALIDAWLEVVATDGHHRALLDLLKSPFVFAQRSREEKNRAVGQLETVLPQLGMAGGIGSMRAGLAALSSSNPEAEALLGQLERARNRMTGGARSIGQWLQSLMATLKDLGADAALEADAAGLQLLTLLQTQLLELADDSTAVPVDVWREWLDRLFEAEMFRDPAVASPVRLTHLAAMRMRSFDAVVVVGADRESLRPPEAPALFFGESVRRELGLPGRDQAVARLRDDLALMLGCAGEVVVTWQTRRGDEPNLPAAEIDLLDLAYTLATGQTLKVPPPAEPQVTANIAGGVGAACAPACPVERLPERISASAYASLVACPYQYFARYVLGLGEQESVAEEMEKSDYGEQVHEILRQFHERFPVLAGHDTPALQDALATLSEAVFDQAVARNFLDHAWRLRWLKRVPAYVAWARTREAEGWKVMERESRRETCLALEDGGSLKVYGVLDRIEGRAGEQGRELAVLDYKTQRWGPLQQRAKDPGEDVQLPFYGMLMGDAVAEAGFVALDDEKVAMVALEDLKSAVSGNLRRLTGVFTDLRGGASFPANGADTRCAWCEMGGLCRRAYAA